MAIWTLSRTMAFCAAGVAFADLAVEPARAQFMAPMRMMVVPPPQPQTIVIPKKPIAQATGSPASTPSLNCHYQGRTQICD